MPKKIPARHFCLTGIILFLITAAALAAIAAAAAVFSVFYN